jgi:hypothetical protein
MSLVEFASSMTETLTNTVSPRSIILGEIPRNKSEVVCWAKESGKAVNHKSKVVKMATATPSRDMRGSLLIFKRFIILLSYGSDIGGLIIPCQLYRRPAL